MALVLDPTASGADANAYVSLEDAIESAAYRVGASAWLELSENQQMQTIVTATRAIDTLQFSGSKTVDDQALEFPRNGDTTVPSRVKDATIDLAISYADAFDDTSSDPLSVPSNIKREQVGSIETEYFAPAYADVTGLGAFPPTIQRLLGRYVITDVLVNQWGSGVVRRGS